MKKLGIILLALMMVMSISACSQKKNESGEINLKGQKVTIWHTYTKGQQESLDAAVKRFNEKNEYGITVVAEQQDRDGFNSKLMQSVKNHVGPDIIIDYATTAADYAKDGLVVDFNKYIDDATYGIKGFKETVYQGTLDEITKFADGGMYAFPLIQSGPIFFYNKDVYTELGLKVPTTWDEVEANAKAIHDHYKGAKYGFAFESLPDAAQTLIAQSNKGVIIDADKKATAFNNEETVKHFEWYGNNVKNGNFMLAPTGKYFSDDFNSGLLASYVGSAAGAPYIQYKNFGTAKLPQMKDGTAWAPAWNRSGIVFTSNASRQMASFLFLKFFATPEENAKFTIASNYASPLKGTIENAEYKAYFEKNEPVQNLSVEIASAYAPLAGTMTLRSGLEGALRAVATGEKDAKQAVEDVTKEADAAISAAYSKN